METTRLASGFGRSVPQQGRARGEAVVTLNVFFDSSALAKRYVHESGSERVDEILAAASSLAISTLCYSEIVSALCRLRREDKISQQEYASAKRAFFEDAEDASVVDLTNEVVARAIDILERYSLRSSDSLHVASAAEWSAGLFVSADGKQCAAARAYGLEVVELT